MSAYGLTTKQPNILFWLSFLLRSWFLLHTLALKKLLRSDNHVKFVAVPHLHNSDDLMVLIDQEVEGSRGKAERAHELYDMQVNSYISM